MVLDVSAGGELAHQVDGDHAPTEANDVDWSTTTPEAEIDRQSGSVVMTPASLRRVIDGQRSVSIDPCGCPGAGLADATDIGQLV
jgi:hypothetical protein